MKGNSYNDRLLKLSPRKTEFPEFMISLSFQNFIPFCITSDLNPVLTEH